MKLPMQSGRLSQAEKVYAADASFEADEIDGFQPKMQICPYGVTPTSRMRRDRKKPKRYAGKQTMQMRKGEERT